MATKSNAATKTTAEQSPEEIIAELKASLATVTAERDAYMNAYVKLHRHVMGTLQNENTYLNELVELTQVKVEKVGGTFLGQPQQEG